MAWAGDSETRDPFSMLVNIEAEQALLGALLLNNNAYEYVVDVVVAGDFANQVHSRLYEAIGLCIASGQRADPVVLKTVFDQDPALAGTLTGKYLATLAQSVITIANAPDYARVIADLARRRDLVITAQDLQADAADLADTARTAADVVADVEKRLSVIDRDASQGDAESLGSIAGKVIGATEAAYKAGGLVTVDTGIADLDRPLSGMDAGALIIVGARPSMGKTALASTIAMNVARTGAPVMFFSLEMTREQLGQRWIAGVTGIETENQRRGQIAEAQWAQLLEARQYLAQLPIYVDDQPRLSVQQMRQRARRQKRRLKGRLGLVIVDHLQHVRQGGKVESRRLEIGDATSLLKAMAKELACPVLVLSQLSRAVEQRDDKRPTLSDLRESGDIEQDADVVMFLYREEYYLARSQPRRGPNQTMAAYSETLADYESRKDEVRGIAEISIPKNRTGRAGMIARVAWDADRQRFTDLAKPL